MGTFHTLLQAANGRYVVVNGDGLLAATEERWEDGTEFSIDSWQESWTESVLKTGDHVQIRTAPGTWVVQRTPAPGDSGSPLGVLDEGPPSTFADAIQIRNRIHLGGNEVWYGDGIELVPPLGIPAVLEEASASRLVTTLPFEAERAALRLVRPRSQRLTIALRVPGGGYLQPAATGAHPMHIADDEIDDRSIFVVVNHTRPESHRLYHGDRISLLTADRRYVVAEGGGGGTLGADRLAARSWETFIVEEVGARGAIDHGDTLILRAAGREAYWAAAGTGTRPVTATATRPEEALRLELVTRRPLRHLYSASATDSFATSHLGPERSARATGYTDDLGVLGYVEMAPIPHTAPLLLYWHPGRQDNALTATHEGRRELERAGYRYARTEGHVWREPRPGALPLKQYLHQDRRDHRVIVLAADERRALDEGYRFRRIEGYLPQTHLLTAVTVVNATIPTVVSQPESPERRPRLDIDPPRGVGERIGPGRIQPIPRVRRRRGSSVALVLSGGGAKGCFEVGAIKQLWQQRIRPDIVCGVSVGALNGTQVAMGTDQAIADLEEIWRRVAAATTRVRYKDHYLETALGLVMHHISTTAGGIARNFGIDILTGWGGAFLSMVDGPDKGLMEKLLYTVNMLHGVHSMEPLRRLIHERLTDDRLRDLRTSGIELRLGITDARTGQFLTVSQPDPSWTGPLARCGRVEVEPDHTRGPNWLTHPIYGGTSYVLPIEDAVYASSAIPVFMEMPLVPLRESDPRWWNRGGRDEQLLVTLSTRIPPAARRILDVTRGNLPRSASEWGPIDEALRRLNGKDYSGEELVEEDLSWRDTTYPLADGGLRDTMPIRTAIRLGARDIYVIAVDRLATSPWSAGVTGMPPLFQYLLRLVSVWVNDSARSDVMLGVAHNEMVGWLYRLFSQVDSADREQVVRDFNQYWQVRGTALRAHLGGSGILGGQQPFPANPYADPFDDEACRIHFIAPDRDLVDSLDFEAEGRILEGIALGEAAARTPLTLSFPVPDAAFAP